MIMLNNGKSMAQHLGDELEQEYSLHGCSERWNNLRYIKMIYNREASDTFKGKITESRDVCLELHAQGNHSFKEQAEEINAVLNLML